VRLRTVLLLGVVMAMSASCSTMPEGKDSPNGRYLFDYGEMVIGVHYLTGDRLAWEQIKGPQAGLEGEELYGHSLIRPGVFFIWWQEEDTSVVTQVVDFEKGRVHTTWTSPEKKVMAFEGTVTARSRE
jgi:molybdenum cofactor biosynthesis MoaF-like protein